MSYSSLKYMEEDMPEIKCPKCDEYYSISHTKCPHCTEEVDLIAEQGKPDTGGLIKKCPFCAEDILAEAVKCKHCQEFLNKKPAPYGTCDDCGSPLRKGSSFCPSCKVMKKPPAPTNPNSSYRKCLQCSYTGKMKTWLMNYSFPKFLVLLGFFFYFIPGIIFLAWGWGKYRCPNCGALAKSVPL